MDEFSIIYRYVKPESYPRKGSINSLNISLRMTRKTLTTLQRSTSRSQSIASFTQRSTVFQHTNEIARNRLRLLPFHDSHFSSKKINKKKHGYLPTFPHLLYTLMLLYYEIIYFSCRGNIVQFYSLVSFNFSSTTSGKSWDLASYRFFFASLTHFHAYSIFPFNLLSHICFRDIVPVSYFFTCLNSVSNTPHIFNICLKPFSPSFYCPDNVF
jgi:hypothetical protein